MPLGNFVFFSHVLTQYSLRGTNAEMILVDEAAFIPLEMFYEVIVPLIGMDKSVLIMISTPVDSYNLFTKLMTLDDPRDGHRLFLTVDFEMACARCKRRGRPQRCTHRLKYLPPWKSQDKQDIINLIMADQQTVLARETFGVVSDEGGSFIPPHAIKHWFDAPRQTPDAGEQAEAIVVAVDPNAAGSGNCSEMAIVSIALFIGKQLVSLVAHRRDELAAQDAHKGVHVVDGVVARHECVCFLRHHLVHKGAERLVVGRICGHQERAHGRREQRGTQPVEGLANVLAPRARAELELLAEHGVCLGGRHHVLHDGLERRQPRVALRAVVVHKVQNVVSLTPLDFQLLKRGLQLVGMDSHACATSDEELRLLGDHLDGLRTRPYLKRAQIILIPERALGHAPGHLWASARNRYNITTVYEKTNENNMGLGDPGFQTRAGTKMKYANECRNWVKSLGVRIADDLVVTNAFVPTETRTDAALVKLKQQMQAYRTVSLDPDNPHSDSRATVSGVVDKYNKRNRSMNDDLMLAFTMCCYMCVKLLDGCLPNFDHRAIPMKEGNGTWGDHWQALGLFGKRQND